MTIPQNFDNPSPLASLDPMRWKEAQARRQADEEREERERYGGTTLEESLACLAAWAEFRKGCKCQK